MSRQNAGRQRARTISSALWAAYGDALGFPMELVGADQARKRIRRDRIESPVAWRKLIGGRFGVNVDLPAGTYSDDTQLRLATSRSIRIDGEFDVESFAKVELPVWLSYSLGAGRGSKTAATSLSLRNTNWFSNFFRIGAVSYLNCGGNGAAMRIQPHIWSAQKFTNELQIASSVLRDSITTHGHIRGIGGAMAHAAALLSVFQTERLLGPDEWEDASRLIALIPKLVKLDGDLSSFWLPTWEKNAQVPLEAATESAIREWETSVAVARSLARQGDDASYREILLKLGGFSDEERGSGLKCALFSMVASWIFAENGVTAALQNISNQLGSDTDSIATMTGALMGANTEFFPKKDCIQDWDYIASEAKRMFDIRSGSGRPGLTYPDLLHWSPPRTALDAVVPSEVGPYLAGLGPLEYVGPEYLSESQHAYWTWFRLPFGQTLLCKRRDSLGSMSNSATNSSAISAKKTSSHDMHHPQSSDLFAQLPNAEPPQDTPRVEEKAGFLDKLSDAAIRSNFAPELIGSHISLLAKEEGGIELVVAYSAIVAKAIRARVRKRGG